MKMKKIGLRKGRSKFVYVDTAEILLTEKHRGKDLTIINTCWKQQQKDLAHGGAYVLYTQKAHWGSRVLIFQEPHSFKYEVNSTR